MSLKDQLMKAGLADAKKAKKVAHEKRVEARDPLAETAAQLAARALAEKAERDRAMNKQLEEEKARKALQAQIRQLIETQRVARSGDVAYQFTDAKKIKKLYVSAAQQAQLVKGLLGIVRLGEAYELVPALVAEKIQDRDASHVVVLNRKAADLPAEDDPYADYQIPDDLMW